MSTPASPVATVILPALAAPVDQLWHCLLDLAAVPHWTLVGGQMVLLHALEHGSSQSVVSQDGDVLADIRVDQGAIRAVVTALEVAGFRVDGYGPDGLAHRYAKPSTPLPVVVDVLAPEGLGANADLTTTKPGRTLQVPGGTQALRRTEFVEIVHEGRRGVVPRPSLLAALVGKGAACGLPGDNARHLRDLALLCSLVDDPFALRQEADRKDRDRMRIGGALRDDRHQAWLVLPQQQRLAGQATFAILSLD